MDKHRKLLYAIVLCLPLACLSAQANQCEKHQAKLMGLVKKMADSQCQDRKVAEQINDIFSKMNRLGSECLEANFDFRLKVTDAMFLATLQKEYEQCAKSLNLALSSGTSPQPMSK